MRNYLFVWLIVILVIHNWKFRNEINFSWVWFISFEPEFAIIIKIKCTFLFQFKLNTKLGSNQDMSHCPVKSGPSIDKISGLFHTVLSVSVGSAWFSVIRFTFFQYNSGFLSGSISSKLSLFISRRSSGSHNQSGYSSLAFSFGSDKKASLSSSLILKISAAFSLQTFKPQQNSWSFFVSWI